MFWKRKVKSGIGIENSCVHDWHELDRNRELVASSSYVPHLEYQDFMYIYCPLCNKTKQVEAAQGNRMLKANEIRKNYQNSNEMAPPSIITMAEWKELKRYINNGVKSLGSLQEDRLHPQHVRFKGKRNGFIDVITKMHEIERR